LQRLAENGILAGDAETLMLEGGLDANGN